MMPNTPNTSFIPKQGPAQKTRHTATRQIHLLTIVSYILFVSTLLASAGVFFYKRHVEAQLAVEVKNLSGAIANFSDADMERVREFNVRLWQVGERLNNSVSLISMFTSLEAATAQSIALNRFTMKRDADSTLLLQAEIETDSFDSALFQRKLYEASDIIETIEIDDLSLRTGAENESGSIEPGVDFIAKLTVPTSAVRLLPDTFNVPVPENPVSTTTATTTVTNVASSTAAFDTADSVLNEAETNETTL